MDVSDRNLADKYATFSLSAQSDVEMCARANVDAENTISEVGNDPELIPTLRAHFLESKSECLKAAKMFKASAAKIIIYDKAFRNEFRRTMAVCPEVFTAVAKAYGLAASLEPGTAVESANILRSEAMMAATCNSNISGFAEEVRLGLPMA
jgi:hypothetical protein